MNDSTAIPLEHETAPLETQLGDFLSHSTMDDEKSPHESLMTEEERAEMNALQSDMISARDLEDQTEKFTDGQIIHEYVDYGLGYRYRRINKGKIVKEDGTQEEKAKIEVDVKIFAKDLPLEDMYMWALRVNFWIGVAMWLVSCLLLLFISFETLSYRYYEVSLWCELVFKNLTTNSVMIGAIFFQRKIYREALVKKEYTEGRIQLSGFVFMPILMVVFSFVLTMCSYYKSSRYYS